MPQVHTTFAQGQERLARDLHTIIEDAEALLAHAVRDAGNEYAGARARLESSLQAARTRLADIENSALDGLGQAGRTANAYVHENPWAVIGASAGLGVVIGLLLGRK